MEQIDPRRLLINIAKILDKLGISYLVTGGMAVTLWGRPRFTADIDIIVELKSENIANLEKALKELGKAGYIDKDVIREALLTDGEFNFVDGETGVKIDFWMLKKKDSFDLLRLKRRISKKILGYKVYFASPEDLILSKLQWYNETKSSRHLEDVESIIKISGKKLDTKYLKQWAEKLGISEFLNEIFNKMSA